MGSASADSVDAKARPRLSHSNSRVSSRARMVSMADVAAAAGVSQQTVSRVVNGKANVSEITRTRVQRAMDQLGFRPNYAGRSLRGGLYRSVGLCSYDITQVGNLTMLDGIVSAARENGYAITLIEMSKIASFSLAQAAREMAEQPVDGMIIGMSRMADDFEDFTPPIGLPTVIVTMYAHPRCTTVDSDHYGCSGLVMDHLFEHGHEQIRFVGGPDFSIDSQFREAGWRDALIAHQIEPIEPLRGDWSANSGYEVGLRLARDTSMTAVYVANDQMAFGLIAALRASGLRVPEDVSVVGIDNSLEAMVPHVELTTVGFDLRERGRMVFEHALPSASTDSVAIRIPGSLIKRGTVADRRG